MDTLNLGLMSSNRPNAQVHWEGITLNLNIRKCQSGCKAFQGRTVTQKGVQVRGDVMSGDL